MAMIEKAMYIKGLCDGLDLDKSTKEGKLLAALLDVVSDLAAEIDDMQSKMSDLEDYCEELDEDLGDVEDQKGGKNAVKGFHGMDSFHSVTDFDTGFYFPASHINTVRVSTIFSMDCTETNSKREWKFSPPVHRLGQGKPS